jgi:hypothetical protein
MNENSLLRFHGKTFNTDAHFVANVIQAQCPNSGANPRGGSCRPEAHQIEIKKKNSFCLHHSEIRRVPLFTLQPESAIESADSQYTGISKNRLESF